MEAGAQRVQEEQRKIEKRRGGKLSFPTFLSAGRLLGVIVETLAGLTAQQASTDHLPQQQGGTVLGVVGLGIQGIHDGQADVQAHQVAQGQGAHGVVGTQLHGSVDTLGGSHAGLHQTDGLVDHGDQDLVDHEAGGFSYLHGLLADVGGQLADGVIGLLGGVDAPDDLHQLHHSSGIEEVHPDEAVGPLGGGGDGGDGDGGD